MDRLFFSIKNPKENIENFMIDDYYISVVLLNWKKVFNDPLHMCDISAILVDKY